jgi:hypothetical protein
MRQASVSIKLQTPHMKCMCTPYGFGLQILTHISICYKFWEHVITLNLEFIHTGHNENVRQDVIYMSNVQFSGNVLRWGLRSYGK